MFTGIIEDLGRIVTNTTNILEIETVLDEIKKSDSVAVNGVCLTVTDVRQKNNKTIFVVEISVETMQRTNLGLLKPNDFVNLERALKLSQRLSGHIVTGHVDTTSNILYIDRNIIEIFLPQEYDKYIVEKGSVAVDGISLTVAKKMDNKFVVALVPYTFEHTNLKYRKLNEVVNLEFDILAKYVENILNTKEKSKITIEFLKQHGFAK